MVLNIMRALWGLISGIFYRGMWEYIKIQTVCAEVSQCGRLSVDCVEKIAFESPHRTPGLRNTSLVLAA